MTRRLFHLFATSVGRKVVVALTGIALLLFLVAHLLGNLMVFQGADALNAYAHWLKSNPLLWVARAGLLAIFASHVVLAIHLARENRAARPDRYLRPIATTGVSRASLSMLVTGLTILAFVVYHLLHFTIGVVDPDGFRLRDAQGRHDVFRMVLHGFASPWITGSYVLAIGLLGVHLWHGAASLLRTLGVAHRSWQPVAIFGARALVAGLVLGNLAIPILVHFGLAPGKESTS